MKLPEGYTVWDPANYIDDEEDARLYLEAVAEEDPGDGSLIRSALCDVARASNMSGLARQIGMSRAGLYKTLSPDGNPSFATIMRLTRALGSRWSCDPCLRRDRRMRKSPNPLKLKPPPTPSASLSPKQANPPSPLVLRLPKWTNP